MDAERSEQRDRHSKISAVHQGKVWGVTPWYEFSEKLAMARDSLKFSIFKRSSYGMHAECGG